MEVEIARLIGSAGSGKTTALLNIMEKALDRLGNDPLRLGFASFTRAARKEAAERAAEAWGVREATLSGEGWFRTVHSTCLRCLGVAKGQLLGGTKADDQWIADALGVKISTTIDEDTGVPTYDGDPTVAAALRCWERARATLQPLADIARKERQADDNCPDIGEIVRIVDRYELAKRVDDRLDFSDLLSRFAGLRFDATDGVSRCSPQGELPPVTAWMFDEQQDCSPLLDQVCKRLISADSVKWTWVVGDPFQAVYGFAGSSAECFLGWKATKERTLDRSYRCPKKVLDLGERCLRRMHRGYFDRGVKAYGRDGEPRPDSDGSILEVQSIEDLVARVDPTEDWLLIARTNFQARRLAAAMHEARKPVRWTKSSDEPTIRSVGLPALLALEKGEPISGAEWARAIQLLPCRDEKKQEVLTRGTKTRWKDPEVAKEMDVIFPDELPSVGASPALVEAIRSGSWCRLVDRGDEWRGMAKRYGPELAAEPRVRVGTVHSVKGAEARNVAVLTTTSKRVETASEDPEQWDEECRIAYVAVTRAKENLVIVNEGRNSTPRMEVL